MCAHIKWSMHLSCNGIYNSLKLEIIIIISISYSVLKEHLLMDLCCTLHYPPQTAQQFQATAGNRMELCLQDVSSAIQFHLPTKSFFWQRPRKMEGTLIMLRAAHQQGKEQSSSNSFVV